MNDIFLKIIESSILASFFILAVIIIRLLFSKKTPKWIMCLLWSLIGIRLLVPVTIESDFSIIPDFSLEYKNDESSFGESFEESVMVSSEIEADISKEEQENSAFVSDEESVDGVGNTSQDGANVSQGGAENTSQGGVGNTSKDGVGNAQQGEVGNTSQGGIGSTSHGGILNVERGETPSFDDGNFENEGKSESKQISISKSFLNVSSVLWLVGTILMLFYGLVKYIMLKRRVSIFSVYKKGIRKCEAIDTPFVLGVIKPYIYLPFNLSEKSEKYIIAHEKAHIKRLDYISKIIAFVVLSVHWFNPLVWLTFSLFCKDIEYACDEKVLKTLDTDEKKDYATALLECSIKGSRITACPVAFGEIGVKERVKNAISYKKPLIWIVIISIILCAVLSVVFLTTKKNKDDNGGNTDNSTENSTENSTDNSTDNSDNSADDLPIADEVLDENLTRLRRARKGDLVWFGKYEQDDNPSNGPEDIDWLVVEEEGTKLLVVSKYSLARIPYNEENVAVTWETCSVRKWLNEEFINDAFNEYERSLIPTVTIHDEKSTYDLLEEKPTQDKVFLLSVTEANKYLRYIYGLSCETTKSAGEKKGDTYDLDHPWWLRSVSGLHNRVTVAESDGSILEKFDVPNNKYGCVRPAMWIDKSDLLKLPENDDNMNNEITHEELEKLASAKVGDYVFFGKYEQDYVFSNGREAIEWQVLESKGNKRLLLSKYALDCRSYSVNLLSNNPDRYNLINWLDDEFYHSSFSRGEKELIVSTKREIGANYTIKNKIMLLSTKDFNKYLKRNKASCEPTAYAYARRIEVCDNGKVYWWLCSDLGEYGSDPASVVNEEGDVKKYSSYNENIGVRPAVWIDLSVVLNPDEPNDESNDVVSPDELEKLKSAKVGDYISFGKFEQYRYNDDKEVLEWQVLASENGKLLVVSKYIIEYARYGLNPMQICYKDSDIRKWLIDYFYNSAFSTSEKSYISPTTITMKNIDSSQNSESVVIDKVFLLSPEEVDKYFVGDIKRECEPTKIYYDAMYNSGFSWWMRSTDSYHTSGYLAATNQDYIDVGYEGPIDNGYIYYYKGSGVRPAMWIDLER